MVDLGAFYLLTLIPGMPEIVAKTISFILGICNSSVWNKLWTFGARTPAGRAGVRSVLSGNLPPLIVNIVVFSLLGLWTTSGSFAVREGKAFIAAVVAVIWNFLGSRILRFATLRSRKTMPGNRSGRGRSRRGTVEEKEHA